jgi:hypothetical protein
MVMAVDDQKHQMTLEGLLAVDGRLIYRMTDFMLEQQVHGV